MQNCIINLLNCWIVYHDVPPLSLQNRKTVTFCEERKEKFYIINDLFVRNNMVEKMRKDEGNVDNTLNAKDK